MSRFDLLLLTTIAAVGGAAVLVLMQYKADLDARRGATARCSRTAQLNNGIVEYAESGTGIPLLSIHGAGGGVDQGLANAAEFVGEGFRIIAPSRSAISARPCRQTLRLPRRPRPTPCFCRSSA